MARSTHFWGYVCGDFLGVTDPGPLPREGLTPMTTATRTHRTARLSAEQRRARQDELLATLADGVLELTTSQGWRRYLRAMANGNSNSRISQPRESIRLLSRWVERPGACLDAEPINR